MARIDVFAAKRQVKKTWGKPNKTKENQDIVFSCFCSVYFPMVSEKSSLRFLLPFWSVRPLHLVLIGALAQEP
jgi:hypothetical protein